ncbi:MAG: OmpH family outer membrane protein [Alphaproteobacteria bacterium]|uniref:OmpH family outer membrane protein n=1 Tax=Candidatus Nitrobium versatile TaxID=2884831 RepID=A0A953J5V8_9BACT|nr:OmpH family outer membrane protein [Candidatus Nitrobium versatile]
MKRYFAAVVVVLSLLLSGMLSAALAETKIGFVDLDKAANESEEGKKAVSGLKEFMSSKQAAVTEKGKAIEKMKADLEKQSSIISAEARRAKVEEIERAERDFQRMVSDINVELEKKRRELTESVYKEILSIVDAMGQEGKYDAILPVQSVLYGNKALDLTDAVIKRYNEAKGAKASSKK